MTRGRNFRATVAAVLLSVGTLVAVLLASAPSTAASSVTTPDPPTLVSAKVVDVYLPIQDLMTFKYSKNRKFGLVRSVWDVSDRTDASTFRATVKFLSSNHCSPTGVCPGNSPVHLG